MSQRSTTRREPQTHWWLLSLLMLTLLSALVLAGLVNGQVGESAESPNSPVGSGQVPSLLRCVAADRSSILCRPDQPGLRIPDRTIVLTFDDGPTPWTQKILDLLRAMASRHLLRHRRTGNHRTRI